MYLGAFNSELKKQKAKKEKSKKILEKLIIPDESPPAYYVMFKSLKIITLIYFIFIKIIQNISNNSNKLNQQEKLENRSSSNKLDHLLEVLMKEGFSNTIQNIILLKRFNNDCYKVMDHLRTGYS